MDSTMGACCPRAVAGPIDFPLACWPVTRALTPKGNGRLLPWAAYKVATWAKAPVQDAAAVNATRSARCAALRSLVLPPTTWSGGRTRGNRGRFGVPKARALDAVCPGDVARVRVVPGRTVRLQATGRG